MPTLKENKEKRAGLVVQMRSLLNTIKGDKKALTAEEEQTYGRLETEVDNMGREIDREDRLNQVEANLRSWKDHSYRPSDPDAKKAKGQNKFYARFDKGEDYANSLFEQYARLGKNGLLPEHVNILTEGSDVDGGYLVPEEFEATMVENLVNADPIRAAATVIRTASDRNIPIETDGGSFTYIGESGTYGTSDPQVGRVILSSFKSGGIVKVSEELLQDSTTPIEPYLQRVASRRYNALEQTAFANGNGSGQPLGIFQTSTVGNVNVGGVTGGISASAAITGDNLIDTFHSLGRAYRDRASWMTSDSMVKMIRKLKDSTNQYLWQPGLSAGQPDRLLNRPIYVSDGAPVPAVSGVSLAFGDWSFYVIADRLGLSMQVLKELYAGTGQVGFRFNKRTDGRMTFAPAMVTFTHGPAS
jgi:HK97 family phage major capsid protein